MSTHFFPEKPENENTFEESKAAIISKKSTPVPERSFLDQNGTSCQEGKLSKKALKRRRRKLKKLREQQ